MKKLVLLFTGLILMAIAAKNVSAQASDNGTATATILTPIAITAGNDLEFGSIASGTQESEVKITTAGVRSLETGNATLYTSDAGQQGTFNVSGQADHTYSITLPGNGAVTLASSGNTMAVKNFVSNPDNTGTLSSSGSQTVNVGATLVVGASQAAGSYTGNYTVTVNYN